MWWTLVVGCTGLALYLVMIAIAPGFSRGDCSHRCSRLDPRIRVDDLARAPARRDHRLVTGCDAWGIPVPSGRRRDDAGGRHRHGADLAGRARHVTGGVGLLSATASGPTDEARAAAVLAFAIVHFVYGTLAQLVAGLACIPLVNRLQPAQKI
jgi:hypothetical protein